MHCRAHPVTGRVPALLAGVVMAERNFANRTLYHGDNLAFLRGMNSGTVNLIATDPPFNKNKDFHATPDSLSAGAQFQDRWSWRDDIHDDWLVAIQRDEPEVWAVITTAKEVWGDDMGAFLCWLGVRLLEMHRILVDSGSIYLHIDHTAHAYVKMLMDSIFGRENFRNEIIWCYSGGGIPRRDFPRKHDTILRYTKSDTYEFQIERKAYKENTQQVGIHSTYTGNNPIDLDRGTPITDWWTDIPTTTGWSPENTGYPTQKPLALYERIIKASSKPGEVVLDPFCGCATTPIAAERQGRHWVGIDIWDGAHQVVLERLEGEGLVAEGRRHLKVQPTLAFGDLIYSTTPPARTDDGEPATLVLRMPTGRTQRYPAPRTQHRRLVTDLGAFCQGCGADYQFDNRVLEVDHINPRSQNGTDAYENLTLLCPPCNKEKRDRYTLIGLQDFNRKQGHMKDETKLWIGRAGGTRGKRRRR